MSDRYRYWNNDQVDSDSGNCSSSTAVPPIRCRAVVNKIAREFTLQGFRATSKNLLDHR